MSTGTAIYHNDKLLPIGGVAYKLPCFFPSISSVKTNFAPSQYLSILRALQVPQFLISAYDIWHTKRDDRNHLINDIIHCIDQNTGILLDCGNYERFWKNDKEWKRPNFHEVLSLVNPKLAFSFDRGRGELEPIELVAQIEREYNKDQLAAVGSSIIPIIHSQRNDLATIARLLANRLNPLMIAVAERDLGNGIIERVNTILRIRRKLNTIKQYIPLHVLGTGNPYSILLFVAAGADSFDGLEWCQTTIDKRDYSLNHFQLREISSCTCRYCNKKGIDYDLATLAHNLLAYEEWMALIQGCKTRNELASLGQQFIGKGFLKAIWRKIF